MSETAVAEERAAVERPRGRDGRGLDRAMRRREDVSRSLTEEHASAARAAGWTCDRIGHWPVEDLKREVVLTERELQVPRLCTICGARYREARALFVHD